MSPDDAEPGSDTPPPDGTPDAALEASIDALAAALDTLAHPLIAVMPDGQLLHANQAAHELLAQEQAFVLGADQVLSPRSAPYRSPFSAALMAASAGTPQQLHWAEGELSLHVTLRPLAAPAASTAQVAPVLLMLAPPDETPFDATGFAENHNLSAAETRVLEVLMHGYKAEEAAERLGVGVATVRSQIAAIRQKTGHRSVASLLATLGDLPPLRKPPPR